MLITSRQQNTRSVWERYLSWNQLIQPLSYALNEHEATVQNVGLHTASSHLVFCLCASLFNRLVSVSTCICVSPCVYSVCVYLQCVRAQATSSLTQIQPRSLLITATQDKSWLDMQTWLSLHACIYGCAYTEILINKENTEKLTG